MVFSKRIAIVTVFLLLHMKSVLYAQVQVGFEQPKNNGNTVEQLARQHFEQHEYEKANTYFEELFDKKPQAWYTYYFKSLLGAKDFSKAEKITRRQLKQNKENVFLYVSLGKVYKLQNEDKKANDAFIKALKELNPVQPHVENLANAFKEERLYDYSIDTYNKARKQNPEYPYFYERAEIYKLKDDLASMINEYLDALEFRESEIETVQANLQNSLGYDDEKGGIKNPLLKQELQKRIQKSPDKLVLTRFLIFIQLQQKDFEGAFVQTRSLDKRMDEEGQRVYELAKICESNQEWEVAKKCYSYLSEKGPKSAYYDVALVEGINMEYLALTQKTQPNQGELVLLEQKFIKATDKYKQTGMYAKLLRNLVFLKAYYLNKGEEAKVLLEDFINLSGTDPVQKAEFKIMLGDIYLINGAIWDASLLYSQVEKDFKHEAIGNEAKFRNAKLSFYAGDFTWAKTQADVLKGSTEKLIANDALDLSLIITDAIGVDTNDAPLKLFSGAELLIVQHRYVEAMARLDSINLLFSSHTLGDDIYYKKAEIYFTLGKFLDVESMYKNILDYYADGLYGDDSQFKLAKLYQENLNDKERAKTAYENVLKKYPGSIFTVEARQRFRELRGDILNN